jgi:hypothetical protein
VKILIYKRTHVGDPNGKRHFGNEGCLGRIRGFAFDAVIGVGGISDLPTQQGIAMKINWVGRCPRKSKNPIDPRGPLVSFRPEDFRLFEHQGPLLANEAPLLAMKLFNSRARFFFSSLSPREQEEAENLLTRILDLCEFDRLELKRSVTGASKFPFRRKRCARPETPVTPYCPVNKKA